MEFKGNKIEKLDWSNLSNEDKRELMEMADSLFIPPQFVVGMYESGELCLTKALGGEE